MKKLFLITSFIFLFSLSAYAQKVEVDQSFVDDATKAFNEVVVLRDEVKVKDQAIDDLKKEITRLQIELAKLTGEKTSDAAMIIRLNAIVDLLLKSVRPKKIGVINFE